jgi:hypothetical protein
MGQATPLNRRQELKELLDKEILTGPELLRARKLILEGSEEVRDLMDEWADQNVKWLQ